ncbi:hypothetical protein LCGC14_1887290 [marine sediment metagenome]|uniref:Uncharacterized protein n=1 Tax=marine sediment metagenome TaxID=412755 RepID=A0A0F9G0Q3_9ZZZZ
MAKKYNLKLSETIAKIVEIYMKFEPLKRGDTISAYIKPAIHKEINKMLNELDFEREKNNELQELLKSEEYKEVLKMLETNKRY